MDSNEYIENFKLLSGMGMLFQSCEEPGDLFDVAFWYLPRLFPGRPGAVYLVDETKKKLVHAYSWPDSDGDRKIPDSESCRALLTGITEDVIQTKADVCLACGCGVRCIPFREGKDSFGLFCLGRDKKGSLSSGYNDLAVIAAEYLSLGISNIRLRKRLHEMTIRDSLTGLFNRRYMDDVMTREIERARRSGQSLGMVMVDLDHFENFNDTYGHDAGDEVLRKVASALVSGLRSEDIVCRFGGEEFFVFISSGRYEDCIGRAQELRKKVKAINILWKGQQLPFLSASFGVAVFPDHGKTFEDVLKTADQALYLAKETGRDKVVGGFALKKNSGTRE